MPADLKQAHRYFLEAAKLGHAEAQAALDMVQTTKTPEMCSEVDLSAVPTPTQVLLAMLGVDKENKSSLAVNATPTSNADSDSRSNSLHWLDLSIPAGKDNTGKSSALFLYFLDVK